MDTAIRVKVNISMFGEPKSKTVLALASDEVKDNNYYGLEKYVHAKPCSQIKSSLTKKIMITRYPSTTAAISRPNN